MITLNLLLVESSRAVMLGDLVDEPVLVPPKGRLYRRNHYLKTPYSV